MCREIENSEGSISTFLTQRKERSYRKGYRKIKLNAVKEKPDKTNIRYVRFSKQMDSGYIEEKRKLWII
ncbi:TVG0934917 [Thermoplasma volcanium GSS1]|uniref:TVG0934917 protein n=1 Tax=Thermoplasma volcanium (strain ATCC 51530 / DSM 4299 / JCM 9571 / NBRC 15438 / GSS1) TaxID=273116 RepID=Q97A99_THEVO|nr:hypothetical protein [Thermoplasma volcanium]BAB60053.1 TVG0934917 [Thermoplasma volcanium GSS1]